MTIKDMEFRTGMTRANIRFYESEGLLEPKRNENRYRDYSEEEFQILMKIKLLRMLHISLEEIKEIHRGEKDLEAVLEQNIRRLEVQKQQIQKSQNVCVLMKNDNVKYETLNAEYYLNSLDTVEEKTGKLSYDSKADEMPKIKAPFRRFFARRLDFSIYSSVFNIVLAAVFGIKISGVPNIVSLIFAVILMILIEPILLSRFGTTIGKAILGIYITDEEGRKLSRQEASDRTWMVLWKGTGFYVPFYALVRLWKSYSGLENNEELEWEGNSVVNLKDKKLWRPIAYIGVVFAIFGLLLMSVQISSMPRNRGDITVAEFAENYNRQARYYDMESYRKLDAKGKWYNPDSSNSVVISLSYETPDFMYTEENGVMTGMSLSVVSENFEYMMKSFQNEMTLAAISFVGAQESCGLLINEIDEIVDKISKSPFEDFEIEAHGVRISCSVEYEGYIYIEDTGVLFDEDTENEFHLLFTMEKIQ